MCVMLYMKQTSFLFSPVSHTPSDYVYVISALYSLRKSGILNTSGPKHSMIVKSTTTFRSFALMEAEPEGSQPFSSFIFMSRVCYSHRNQKQTVKTAHPRGKPQ